MAKFTAATAPSYWTTNGAALGYHTPIQVSQCARVELTFHNMSMMAHPLHLHGHVFQVIAVCGRPVQGALCDAVLVPAIGAVGTLTPLCGGYEPKGLSAQGLGRRTILPA